MSTNLVQVGTRVVTRDSYDLPTREMGYVTGTVVALRVNLGVFRGIEEATGAGDNAELYGLNAEEYAEQYGERSPVELAVIWDHQTDSNPLDPSDGGTHAAIDYLWTPMNEVVTAPATPHAYIGTGLNPFGDVPGMTRF